MAEADTPSATPVPVIGLLGAPGSGKSTIAQMFAALGCAVIDADRLAREALDDPDTRETLAGWWGSVVLVDGQIDRQRVGKIVFNDPKQRRRLEGLVHPYVNRRRTDLRRQWMAAGEDAPVAVVEDCPLLIEAGLAGGCEVLVYVEAPLEERRRRVNTSRGWSDEELAAREAAQAPLDAKRRAADYTVHNVGDRDTIQSRVADVLNDILQAHARARASRA